MKFTTSKNKTWRSGIGDVPKAWIDYDLDHKASINKYFDKHIRIYDADICGDKTVEFVFEDGKTFKLEYSWWIDEFNENPELRGLQDEIYLVEIESKELKEVKPLMRDWI